MTSSPPPLVRPLPAESVVEAVDTDTHLPLDERIRRAEQRLMARDAAVGTRLLLIGERVQRGAAQPGQLLVPGLAAAGALVALVLGVRRLTTPVPVGRATGHARWPWLRLLMLGWPLLPARWRSRVNPATATALATVGMPLLERLFRRRAAA